MISRYLLLAACSWLVFQGSSANGQARISEEARVLATYPFSDPDPVPILASDRRLYPYHSFDGYAATSQPREWKVVKLENDLIEVYVLPEIGGKVWGAVIKETGQEFIYRNEVVKFRDIALRGPWTSGGIEFNFGVIGHSPATATPVDYLLRSNDDGSVSCIVGAMDLPSRTHWRVEIRLPEDRAYFETRVLWYNPTPHEQPYYSWMTAAASATGDLELFVPGSSYLEHSGRRRPWPVDEAGRFLPLYRNNAFGGHKSYHVVGELTDFFGGYYHDHGFGWGHWARYEEMPGRKMWLWALSDAGGVWEELLTDTDGQYVEFQAGRLFVQYSPGDHRNPIAQASFDPLSASVWTESWFPLAGTGGLSDASREGAMHVERAGNRLIVTLNSFGKLADTLRVRSGDREEVRLVELEPLTPRRESFRVEPDSSYRVVLEKLDLDYASDRSDRLLSRPFAADDVAGIPETDLLAFEARELAKGRRYREARVLFEEVVRAEPWHREARLGLAALALRSARYEEGLGHANRALQLDAYDARANFLAGSHYLALGRNADARDAFGWSARRVEYRAASYIRLAELATRAREWEEARRYAALALDFDRNSLPALRLLALHARRTGDGDQAEWARARLLEIDPLHHFALAEDWLESKALPEMSDEPPAPPRLSRALRSEYRDQTLLELATQYAVLGLPSDALAVLDLMEPDAPAAPIIRAWRAYLTADPSVLRGLDDDLAFAFPFRTETLPVLDWAVSRNEHWGWRYLLGLNLWALDRDEETAAIFERLGDEARFGPFYAARGHLLQAVSGRDPAADFDRAAELAPEYPSLHATGIRHAQATGDWNKALELSLAARVRFPDDFDLDLLHVRSLLALDRPLEAAELIGSVRVLPSENARDSHRLYELAHLTAAMDELENGDANTAREHLAAARLWPESLGQGRPYDSDERLVRYLLGVVAELEGDPDAARREFEAAADIKEELRPRDENEADEAGVQSGERFFAERRRGLLQRAEALRESR